MGRVARRPLATEDLIAIWEFIAEHDVKAADGMLDRIEAALTMLADHPLAGRERGELAEGLRSFPVGRFVVFYRPAGDGIELVRVLNGYRDFRSGDVA